MSRTGSRYVPDRGDFVWIDLDPHRGHEPSGHRPALVLSPEAYNRRTGLCVVCPASRRKKGYPFEVENPSMEEGASVILADHVRNVDWTARRVRKIHWVASEVLQEVVARLEALILEPDA